MENKKSQGNKNMSYQRSKDPSRFMSLFNCFKCGFHETVIVKLWIKGYEDDYIVRLHTIHPEKEEKVENIVGEKLSNDGTLVVESICGKCGKVGSIENVPNDIIELYGYIPKPSETEKSKKKSNIFSRLIKKRKKK